jgi:hypothetical protein
MPAKKKPAKAAKTKATRKRASARKKAGAKEPTSPRPAQDPRRKKFFLSADQIRPLAKGHGACFATDRITVDGRSVGFMYREAPDRDIDSGWRFMAGDESQAYMDDPDNLAIYDVNTIANYDPEIIPFLDAPIGLAFERDDSGAFVEVAYTPPDD